MKSKKENSQFVAFLRGINVGGHHKVPMKELSKELEKLHCQNVHTLLNSGNIIFETVEDDLENLEKRISENLEKSFGFPIPTILRKAETIIELYEKDPFKNITVTKDIRLYVSFLKNDTKADFPFPWKSDDHSYFIINKIGKTILSVLDLSISQTPAAMAAMESHFGKDITTRNWNTIQRIIKKLVTAV